MAFCRTYSSNKMPGNSLVNMVELDLVEPLHQVATPQWQRTMRNKDIGRRHCLDDLPRICVNLDFPVSQFLCYLEA